METAAATPHPHGAMTQNIVLCGVDATDAGTAVLTAAKAAAERAGAPLLLTHVVTSLWGAEHPGLPGRRGLRAARRARPARRRACWPWPTGTTRS